MIVESIEALIGKTPLLHLSGTEKECGLSATLLAKLESLNPAGSAKDRVALQMILDAEREGILSEGCTIIEPTSGNTGIGLASIAAIRGYQVILTMPESMSVERRKLLGAYGAKIRLTDAAKGMDGAIEEAERLAREIPNSWIPGQFSSLSNKIAHFRSTGPEIWDDCEGNIDVFIACVGTGGTITGVGEYLKEKNPNVHVVAVEPSASPVLSGGKKGPHGIQGIGAGFVPAVLNTAIYDEIYCATEEDAYRAARMAAKKDGILIGISSGAALSCAIELAKRKEWAGKRIVVFLPDGGEKYLSTPLFEE